MRQCMLKLATARVCFVLICLSLTPVNTPIVRTALLHTQITGQADPVGQCAEGVRLAQSGDAAALPLLEAGFLARERATFSNPDDLVLCALALGWLYDGMGESNRALDA